MHQKSKFIEFLVCIWNAKFKALWNDFYNALFIVMKLYFSKEICQILERRGKLFMLQDKKVTSCTDLRRTEDHLQETEVCSVRIDYLRVTKGLKMKYCIKKKVIQSLSIKTRTISRLIMTWLRIIMICSVNFIHWWWFNATKVTA